MNVLELESVGRVGSYMLARHSRHANGVKLVHQDFCINLYPNSTVYVIDESDSPCFY